LCRRSLSQRLEIGEAFRAGTNRNLIDEIRKKLKGDVKNLYIGLLMNTAELYCRQLKKMKNDGTVGNVAVAVLTLNMSTDVFEDNGADDSVLIEIMCTMKNSEIKKICATYHQFYGKRLEQAIRENKSGSFKTLLKILSAGDRDESPIVDLEVARNDVECLKKNFDKFSSSEEVLIEIFTTKSYSHLKIVAEEFTKLTGIQLEKSIKKNTSGSFKKALLAIIRTAINPPEFFARRINKAINNHILDNRSLGRMIIVRSEIDLMDIKFEFNRIFRKSLMSCLKGDVGGSYRDALMVLMGEGDE
jgi:hypothetical protein